MAERFQTFRAFWPWYLREHSRPGCRLLHYLGTLNIFLVPALVLTFDLFPWPWLFLAVPIAGYGPSWFGHLVVEGNRPATMRYPIWAFWGDMRMFGLAIAGKLQPELDRAFAEAPAGESAAPHEPLSAAR